MNDEDKVEVSLGWSLSEVLVTAVLFAIFAAGVFLLWRVDLAALRDSATQRMDRRVDRGVGIEELDGGVNYIIDGGP